MASLASQQQEGQVKLNTNSWHYKMWANSFSSYESKPYTTDLCRYCHRVFWQLVARAFLGVMIGVLCWMLVWGGLYQGLYLHTKLALCIVGAIALILGVVIGYSKWMHGDRGYRSEPKTLAGKYARAAKDGVCPIIQFDGDHKTSARSDDY